MVLLEVQRRQMRTMPSATPMARRSRYQRSTRVFLGEPVSTEELHTVEADLHALLGSQLPGQSGFASEGQALLGA